VEGSYLCFGSGAVGEASGSGRGGGAAGLFRFVSGGLDGRAWAVLAAGRCWLATCPIFAGECVLGG
jgi:hypothetical protein